MMVAFTTTATLTPKGAPHLSVPTAHCQLCTLRFRHSGVAYQHFKVHHNTLHGENSVPRHLDFKRSGKNPPLCGQPIHRSNFKGSTASAAVTGGSPRNATTVFFRTSPSRPFLFGGPTGGHRGVTMK